MDTVEELKVASTWSAVEEELGCSPYTISTCRAILVGFRNQMVADEKCRDGVVGMLAEEEGWAPILHIGMTQVQAKKAKVDGEVFRDDMTGQM